MPIENREIIFSSAELRSAVADFLRRSNDHPGSEVTQVMITDKAQEPVAVTLYSKAAGQREAKALSLAQVAAALMVHCKLNDILMPRTGQKSVEVRDGQVVLKIRLVSGQAAGKSSASSLGT